MSNKLESLAQIENLREEARKLYGKAHLRTEAEINDTLQSADESDCEVVIRIKRVDGKKVVFDVSEVGALAERLIGGGKAALVRLNAQIGGALASDLARASVSKADAAKADRFAAFMAFAHDADVAPAAVATDATHAAS